MPQEKSSIFLLQDRLDEVSEKIAQSFPCPDTTCSYFASIAASSVQKVSSRGPGGSLNHDDLVMWLAAIESELGSVACIAKRYGSQAGKVLSLFDRTYASLPPRSRDIELFDRVRCYVEDYRLFHHKLPDFKELEEAIRCRARVA